MLRISSLFCCIVILGLIVNCGTKKNSEEEQSFSTCQNGTDCHIDAVFLAQTHVQEPSYPYFSLVSDREALIKVHIGSSLESPSPKVSAVLSLNGDNRTLNLTGPLTLPSSLTKSLGKVLHNFDDTFTGYIPKEWVKPDLSIKVTAGDGSLELDKLNIGAPNKLIMNMFDVHFFSKASGDYPTGWKEELELKLPISDLELRRFPDIVFTELVIPPRANVSAAKVLSKEDYKNQTGLDFDGEQAAATQWKSALKAAAGTAGRISLYYVNIYGVHSGGQAGGFGGVGNGTSIGILHHELGHAFSLPHWGNNNDYPYRGDMYGIPMPEVYKGVHVGPVWGFDLFKKTFIPPTVQENSVGGTLGTYKKDPMQGGGKGDQEEGFLIRHFSDYSVNKIKNYLQKHIVLWNEELSSYVTWDEESKEYNKLVMNNGVSYPIQRNTDVISVMASISAAKQDVNMVYPPIGPYISGLIRLFDPSIEEHRNEAKSKFCPNDGCDLSLRITQDGVIKTYMLAASWDETLDPLKGNSLQTKAVNLPASEGEISQADLLLTPDADTNGLSQNPRILFSWKK